MGKVRKKLKVHIKVRSDIPRVLPVGARLNCTDNSGAKVLQIIAVKGFKTRKKQISAAGVGDMAICSVKEGNPEMKKEVVPAVIVRQKKEYRRPNGERIKFYDNAAVVMTPEGEVQGTEIRGPISREAAQLWYAIGSLAKVIV